MHRCALDLSRISAALESAALSYLSSHYHDGVATVLAMSPTQFAVQIVSNKYNPSNYWFVHYHIAYVELNHLQGW
jgi:capping protein alpha